MIGLSHIHHVSVPRSLAIRAHAHLRDAGQHGSEGFALWAGTPNGNTFRVLETIIPAQSGLRMAYGVCVTVAGDELHRINLWLYQHKMTLIAQLHSHPDEAYHSETDDTFPIATTVGSFSIVIPNFARDLFALDHCAIYRLTVGGWLSLSSADAQRLLIIE